MVRLLALVALIGCRGSSDVEQANAMLAAPPGGRVDAPAAKDPKTERIKTVICYEGKTGAELAEPLRASLARAGWKTLLVEQPPQLTGKWVVRGVQDKLALAGGIEEGAEGCAGAKLTLGSHALPPGGGSNTAGAPRGQLPATK